METFPIRQKKLVGKVASGAGSRVVVATQMLDSMIRTPAPTRAEVAEYRERRD